MTIPMLRAAMIGLLLAGAAPLLAQNVAAPIAPAAPAAPAAAAAASGDKAKMRHGPMHGGAMRGGMFGGLSDAGRTVMRDAMQAGGDPRADHAAVKAARDRMLVLLETDKLDTAALRRAMDDERKAAQLGHDRRQSGLLAGFSKLTAADRKLFVANARVMQGRMAARVGKMRGGRDGHPGPDAAGADMPPM